MANIKISELNELYEAQKDYTDYLPIVDTSADETKKISVKNLTASGVQLIAVSDTEPEEYETGDKYYNTTNNKIYTATSSGWYLPETPIRNIFYIILDTQNIYTYDMDNETLVSVGGGAGGGDSAPIGQVSMYAGSTAPDGFLMCDGAAVSRETYADLFRVIGTTYGSGDGSTTFNVPNLKGKVVVMLDSNDTDFDTLGETGGNKVSSHVHGLSDGWAQMQIRSSGKVQYDEIQVGTNTWTATYEATGANGQDISETGNYGARLGGSSNSANASTLQPYIVLNYIIKVQKLAGEVLSEQLPVGTEVDFDGSASDIPIGWEQVDYTLYSNSSGSASNIQLSDSVANYKYIEIYFRTNDGASYRGSSKVDIVETTTYCTLMSIHYYNGTYYNKIAEVTLSGTALNFVANFQLVDSGSATEGSYIYVTSVIGYK